ncbi:unnamed protein product [Nesidiocoris tenuis]|uniref:Uncharacterized protein n=1 Tax=Nesidiocoris tenuis TaxID=355587 RepID=A0A6H5G940_9HEMI|nr:unnamed protein product [Nesidiocoris tenuis]
MVALGDEKVGQEVRRPARRYHPVAQSFVPPRGSDTLVKTTQHNVGRLHQIAHFHSDYNRRKKFAAQLQLVEQGSRYLDRGLEYLEQIGLQDLPFDILQFLRNFRRQIVALKYLVVGYTYGRRRARGAIENPTVAVPAVPPSASQAHETFATHDEPFHKHVFL